MQRQERDLCRRCKNLNLQKLFTKNLSVFFHKDIGRWSQVRESAKACALCALVVHTTIESLSASSNQVISEPSPGTKVKLINEETWGMCVSYAQIEGGDQALDYTNKSDLKDVARKASTRYQYRIVIKYDILQTFTNTSEPQIQVLGPINDKADSSSFLGRRISLDHIDISLLNDWMQRCRHYHHRSCSEPGATASNLPLNFRLIDLQDGVVVPATKSYQYAAMSYCWGNMGWQMPTSRSVDAKTKVPSAAVLPLPARLPRTIEDSMTVARALGFRYLWNDSLCIMQDDPADKEAQINRMDAIYSSAELTIVAASGSHANVGIHGISEPRVYHQQVERIQGLNVVNVLPNYTLADRGGTLVWNTRGWTLQEKLLSRRLLLFTDQQCYYKCKNAIWCEDTAMETSEISRSIERRSSPFSWIADGHSPKPESSVGFIGAALDFLSLGAMNSQQNKYAKLGMLPKYTAVVQSYLCRRLGDPLDILRAITGILNTLNLGEFYAGLPHSFLELALLWQPNPGPVIRRQQSRLPSWSWASWEVDKGCSWELKDLERARIGVDSERKNNLLTDPRYSKVSVTDALDHACGPIQVIRQSSIFSGQSQTRDPSKEVNHPSQDSALSRSFMNNNENVALLLRTQIVTFTIGKPIASREPVLDSPLSPVENTGPSFCYHELVDSEGLCVGHINISLSSLPAPSSSDSRGKPNQNLSYDFLTLCIAPTAAFAPSSVATDSTKRNPLPLRSVSIGLPYAILCYL